MPILLLRAAEREDPPFVESVDQRDAVLREIQGHLEKSGFQTRELGYDGFFDSQRHVSAFVLILPPVHPQSELQGNLGTFGTLLKQIVANIRIREPDVPIFLFGKHMNKGIVPHATSFIDYENETAECIAQNIASQAHNYWESSLPVFFRNLVKYVRSGADSWHCPGHSGGAAFLKSPAGQIFHQFFGENLLRADVCNAVESLGQLLEHSGHIGESECNAARIFGADRLYFVTNGTSASNKIVAHASLSQGDLVLVDRGCHQSILHAIIQTGALPIFLRPTCNSWGIAGPVPEEQFCTESIENVLHSNPLVRARDPKIKAMILTQGTYDGILYNTQTIKQNLDGYIPVLHFDEAWAPHTAFHGFYFSMYAMHSASTSRQRAQRSTVYATQSSHKLLCGLSQASQILVQNASETPLDPAPLEAAFLMHSSTSPQYSILASLDVSAAMMGTPHGRAMVDEAIREALHFRRELRQYGENLGDWWFTDWGPPDFCIATAPNTQTEWQFAPHTSQVSQQDWHGFHGLKSPNFNMLDPIKCTLLTPGLNPAKGSLNEWGIPAPVVSRYLQENGIIVEKTGLYSILIMFTIGITRSRWKALLRSLQRFHADYEAAAPLPQVMAQLCSEYPQYAGWTLPQLCQKLHECYRQNRIVEQSHLVYSRLPEPRFTPSEAYAAFVRGQYEAVAKGAGRVSASMISIYPPGIPLIFPGEVISAELEQYLLSVQMQQRQFPGFQIHIHGAKMHDSLLVNVLKV